LFSKTLMSFSDVETLEEAGALSFCVAASVRATTFDDGAMLFGTDTLVTLTSDEESATFEGKPYHRENPGAMPAAAVSGHFH
jgi:hypothetical protein